MALTAARKAALRAYSPAMRDERIARHAAKPVRLPAEDAELVFLRKLQAKPAAVPEITLESPLSSRSGAFMAHWNDPRTGSRCHVWIRLQDVEGEATPARHIEPVIYVNPALQADGTPVPRTSPDYFDTRRRDLDAKANAAIRDEIRRISRPAILQGIADAKRLEEVRTMKANLAEARTKRILDAVATIQGATGDELAAAMLDASTETAAAAETLRAAR